MIILSSCGTAKRFHKTDHTTADAASIKHNVDAGSSLTPASFSAKALIAPEDAQSVRLIEQGKASWYGPGFNGGLTADGETYNMNEMTAAHRTLPFNTLVIVQNIDNSKTAVVRINDRGPFVKNRIIDLSNKAAEKLGMIGTGTAHVKLYIAKATLDPSDSSNLNVPTYTLQLGSFESETRAYYHADQIKGSRVVIIHKNNHLRYRVYYGLYIHKQAARKKQKELKQQNFSCFIKQIEN
jgi:rare lipoprotein A